MLQRKALAALVAVCVLFAVIITPVAAQDGDGIARPEGWDDYSHSKDTEPVYEIVFPQDQVNTITITIAPENWQAMLDDMTDLYGEFGTGHGGGRDRGGDQNTPGQRPGDDQEQSDQMLEVDLPQQGPGGGNGGGNGGGGMNFGSTENPIWVPADIEFEGTVWTNVGIRFKGNSSLSSTWGNGLYKLPFKLDFDEFEDVYPEIDNQRFYGFKQLSFSSGFSDDSLLREKVTADVFREAGIPSAQTAFYAVYVDYGEGPLYFGLYTAVEVVDDTLIDTQFDDNDGNVYKPEGTGATFAAGTFDEETFDKETNEDEADYSDILALFDALHADTRLADPAAWRADLEAVLDVDEFIHWLAVNQVVQNWDTYGSMAHNYYLYTDPTTGLITWIPWDNNMAMMSDMGGGGRNPGGRATSLDLESVTEQWPLIRYLMDDEVYHALYVQYVEETVTGVFEPSRMEAIFQTDHDLIAPYVEQEQTGYTYLSSYSEFETALSELIDHVNARYTAAMEYVNGQTSSQ